MTALKIAAVVAAAFAVGALIGALVPVQTDDGYDTLDALGLTR